MNREDKIKEANIRLSIKKVLLSLQRKKEEIMALDDELNKLRINNQSKEEEIAKLKEQLNHKREIQREKKRKQLIGNRTFDSLNMMIKYDRQDTCTKNKEYLEEIKKRTELLNEVYQTKYAELENLFKIYSDVSMKRRIIKVKTKTKI